MPILAGIKVYYYPDPTDGVRLAERFAKWSLTIMCGAPTFIKGMLKGATADQMKTMRLCVTGAEKAPPDMLHRLQEFGKGDTVLEGYGITECSPVLTMTRPDRPRKGVGQPLPGIDLLIVHPETHEILPVNTQGLILARGPNIFSGYLNPGIEPPFLNVDGKEWYKTGDLGSLDEENNLTISGRLKRFIKIGGEMISLSSIEDGLYQMGLKQGWPIHEEGPTLAVSAKEKAGEKTRIFLFSTFDLDLDNVNKSLKEAGFSNLVKVSSIIRLSDIPIMGTGKVNYRLLEQQYITNA
jgi:long-chain-fatty-acid--[acyl-carrier-protein] ligase